MQIIVFGMHRSGHNAIARWLLYQHKLVDKWQPLESINSSRCFFHTQYCEMPFTFLSNIMHVDNESTFMNHITDITVMSAERTKLEDIDTFIKERGLEGFQKVLVVRDYLNWIASVLQMSKNTGNELDLSFLELYRYVTHLEEYVKKTNWYSISYGNWVLSHALRKLICKQLNITFTDIGINVVAPEGGGSSFDKIEDATKMRVLERWKYFKDTPIYWEIINKLPAIRDFAFAELGDASK